MKLIFTVINELINLVQNKLRKKVKGAFYSENHIIALNFSLFFFVPINIVIHFQKYQSSAIISVELSKILKLILSLPKMNIEIKTFLFKNKIKFI